MLRWLIKLLEKLRFRGNAKRAEALLRGDVLPVDGQTVRLVITLDVAERLVAERNRKFMIRCADRSTAQLFRRTKVA